jgi:hypothetical protein
VSPTPITAMRVSTALTDSRLNGRSIGIWYDSEGFISSASHVYHNHNDVECRNLKWSNRIWSREIVLTAGMKSVPIRDSEFLSNRVRHLGLVLICVSSRMPL